MTHPARTPIPSLPGFVLPLTLLVALLLVLASCGDDSPTQPPGDDDSTKVPVDTLWEYDSADTLCSIADPRITELSGLAASQRRDGLFWAHNDSGDKARLFAIDSAGNTLAVCTLAGAEQEDWEDMASVRIADRAWLYVGDIGDNGASRDHVVVWRLEEPDIPAAWRDEPVERPAERAQFTFEDGPRDCEALFVDPRDGMLYVIEKTDALQAGIYGASWPGDGSSATLRRVAELALPFSFGFLRRVTAADLRSDAAALVCRTYGAIIELRGSNTQSIPGLVAADSMVTITSPLLPQAEAVCYSRDGRAILTSSEGSAMPLLRLSRR